MSIDRRKKIRKNTGTSSRRPRTRVDDGGLTAFLTGTAASELESVLGRAGTPLAFDELYALVCDRSRSRTKNEVLSALERLIDDGTAVADDEGKISLSHGSAWLEGTVSGTRSGMVFFDPDTGTGDEGVSYVFSQGQGDAVFPGDRVRVARLGFDSKGRNLVSLKEVTEHNTWKVVGVVRKQGTDFWLDPSDPRVHVQIRLSGASALAGQGVVAAITTQPTLEEPARAQVEEILGSASDASVEIEMAARRFGLPSIFAPDVLTEARALPDHVLKKDAGKRVDLRDIAFVTIDGEDARDFDDAVWCAPLVSGGYRLLVAIADVSWYVKPGTALDRSAQERLTSVYFPRRVIPMLPEELSNGLCSLNPKVDRCTMVCDALIDAKGEVTAYQFYPGLINSHARLTYTQVWNALQDKEGARDEIHEVYPDVENLYSLYKVLAEARKKRGAINFETRETYIQTDETGRITAILPREHNDAHRLIEEAMLVANTCAADFIVRKKTECLFRIHEGPSEERLELLRTTLSGFGLKMGGGSSPKPADYEAVMAKVRGTPNEEAVQTALLRSMQRAVYSPELHGHFGLAYPAYTHFTSPIRRYPDLLVHRTIRGILSRRRYKPEVAVSPSDLLNSEFSLKQKGKKKEAPKPEATPYARPTAQHAAWETLGKMCSAAERRADEASYDVTAWLKCMYMKDFIGRGFSGKVTGVTPNGVYVTLDDLFVEGFIRVSNLGWDYYFYNSDDCLLEGSASGEVIRLGTPLEVQVAGVDVDLRRIDFERRDVQRRKGPRRWKGEPRL